MSTSPTLSFDQIIRIHYMVLKAGLNQDGMNQDFTKMGTISSILIQHWHKKFFFIEDTDYVTAAWMTHILSTTTISSANCEAIHQLQAYLICQQCSGC